MAIPNSQLETWSHQGAVQIAKDTRVTIYNALESGLPLSPTDYEVYLQGSYGNDTNIWADSDVDVVAQLKCTVETDYGWLNSSDAQQVQSTFSEATYTWWNFRTDVIAALRAKFGDEAVEEGSKCIKVAEGPNRLPADVVVAEEFRRYYRANGTGPLTYIEGIVFTSMSDYRKIVNFPKQHYANGVDKMKAQRTAGRFKPLARVFKNMRNRMIAERYIRADLAPSYFLQCWVYNAQDPNFRGELQAAVESIIAWYWHLSDSDKEQLVCQNEQEYLFGPTPEQWNSIDADTFVRRAWDFWNDWS